MSCKNNSSYIYGKWKIESVGSADSSKINESPLFYGVLTMLSNGAIFEFNKNGIFKISNGSKVFTTGDFNISPDNKTLILKVNNSETIYELIEKKEKSILLKSKKDASVIELKKE
jgi:hypothetical protein